MQKLKTVQAEHLSKAKVDLVYRSVYKPPAAAQYHGDTDAFSKRDTAITSGPGASGNTGILRTKERRSNPHQSTGH